MSNSYSNCNSNSNSTLYYDAPSNTSREEDEEDPKNCSKIAQNFLYCSLGYVYKHIGTPNFLVKVLWVYSHLKSDFFWMKKLLNVT